MGIRGDLLFPFPLSLFAPVALFIFLFCFLTVLTTQQHLCLRVRQQKKGGRLSLWATVEHQEKSPHLSVGAQAIYCSHTTTICWGGSPYIRALVVLY